MRGGCTVVYCCDFQKLDLAKKKGLVSSYSYRSYETASFLSLKYTCHRNMHVLFLLFPDCYFFCFWRLKVTALGQDIQFFYKITNEN